MHEYIHAYRLCMSLCLYVNSMYTVCMYTHTHDTNKRTTFHTGKKNQHKFKNAYQKKNTFVSFFVLFTHTGPIMLGDLVGEMLFTIQRHRLHLRGDVASTIVTMSLVSL